MLPIPLSQLTLSQTKNLEHDLTHRQKAFDRPDKEDIRCFWHYDKKECMYYVPALYATETLFPHLATGATKTITSMFQKISSSSTSFSSSTTTGPPPSPPPPSTPFSLFDMSLAEDKRYAMQEGLYYARTLWDTDEFPQVKAKNLIVSYLKKYKVGMLVLPTGTGKTDIAIAAALDLGGKTLFVAGKTGLLTQASERIQEIVKHKDPTKKVKVGLIQGKTCDTEGCDFVVGSLSSLLKGHKYPSEQMRFTTLIFDEAHHALAPGWLRSLSQYTRTLYKFFVTATPEKANPPEFLRLVCGDIIYEMKPIPNPDIEVKRIVFDEGKQEIARGRGGAVQFSRTWTLLAQDMMRNHLILKIITVVWHTKPDAHCIFFAHRSSQLLWIYNTVRNSTVLTFYNSKVNTEYKDQAEWRRDKARGVKFTSSKFATLSNMNMLGEGYDNPLVDTVGLLSPTSNSVQANGRIRKKNIKPGKKGLIIDINDPHGPFARWNEKRAVTFTACEFVQHMIPSSAVDKAFALYTPIPQEEGFETLCLEPGDVEKDEGDSEGEEDDEEEGGGKRKKRKPATRKRKQTQAVLRGAEKDENSKKEKKNTKNKKQKTTSPSSSSSLDHTINGASIEEEEEEEPSGEVEAEGEKEEEAAQQQQKTATKNKKKRKSSQNGKGEEKRRKIKQEAEVGAEEEEEEQNGQEKKKKKKKKNPLLPIPPLTQTPQEKFIASLFSPVLPLSPAPPSSSSSCLPYQRESQKLKKQKQKQPSKQRCQAMKN